MIRTFTRPFLSERVASVAAGVRGALHESVLKRIHVAAGVTRHLHDSLGRRGFFKMQAF